MKKSFGILGLAFLVLCSCNANSNSSESASFSDINKHKVSFLNYDGSTLFEKNVDDRNNIFYEGEEPTRKAPNNKTYYYDFYKWDAPLTNIKEDIVVKPIFHIIETKNPIDRDDYTYRPMYKIEGNDIKTIGYEIYKYNNFDFEGTLEVPSTFNNLPVLRIGEACFMECNIKRIILPSTIEVIDQFAFNSCTNLEYVNIPDNTYSLKRAAFYYSEKLETISINNINFLREDNFLLCKNLNRLNVSEKNQQFKTIEGCLYSKSEDVLVKIPEGKGNVEISNNTRKIKSEAIARLDKMKEITIPQSVIDMEEAVFFESKVESITILGNIDSIPDRTFLYCRNLKEINIPNSIKTIGARAFYDCRLLENIIMPDSVNTIGDFAFAYCTSLKEIYIPNSLKNIGDGAFIQLDSLEKFSILNNPFYTVYEDALYSKNYEELYRVPQKKTNINIHGATKVIKADAFYWCSIINEITLPNSLMKIEKYAFYFCNNVYELDIPDTVLSIEESAFEGMESLIRIHLPNNLTVLESSLFENCALLQEVNIPSKVTKIGDEVFYNCINLPSLVIYDSLKEFGKDVFAACNMLDDIYFTGSEAQWKSIKGLSNCALTSETTIHFEYK
ncbi:MAG: leucine-rich repeat domain-containing protein [Erysipelotrichales bacterium]|nr:leucine-rich repeat domain-containing protein [Erysipelotrichales bacterium]